MNSMKKARGGRPTKGAGPHAVAVNLRMAPDDFDVLAELAPKIRQAGQSPPTVQDVIRGLIRGAIMEPDTLHKLVSTGMISFDGQ